MMSGMAGPNDNLQTRLQSALGEAYSVERELGGGGMSRVFVARDERLGRLVAIKVLLPDIAAEVSAARFEREVRLAARLQHPHLVPLLSAGDVDGLPFYLMPFIDGETLRQRFVRTGALPVAEVVRLLRELADALAYAHEQGVVHRDLKPENVLLARGHALVTDFGVAKALVSATQGDSRAAAGTVTALGLAVGTPAYMAPEQAMADPSTDHRAGLYALGIIAYEALAGAHPFAGRSSQALVAAHLTESPAPLIERRSELPTRLVALVQRLLAKQPADRPSGADEVLRELEGLDTFSSVPGGSVTAGAPSQWLVGRRRTAVGAIAVMLILAVGGASMITRWRGAKGAAAVTGALDSAGTPAAVGIAILPFESRGPTSDGEDADFADGLADAVRSQLAQLSSLRVIDGRSAGQYRGTAKSVREIGQELGVPYLLQATVRWARGADGTRRVQVSPALVRVADAATIWSVPVVPEPTDVFAAQTAVARQVADALNVRLGSRERALLEHAPTSNPAAYEAYLRGLALRQRAFLTPEGGNVAAVAEAFSLAVERDPGFGLGWAALAAARVGVSVATGTRDTVQLAMARAALDSARRLAPDAAETHLARAQFAAIAEGNVTEAVAAFRAAYVARPNDAEVLQWLSTSLVFTPGQLNEGIAFSVRAADLDPRNAQAAASAASRLLLAGRAQDALRYAERAVVLEPDQFMGYEIKSLALLESGAGMATVHAVIDSAAAHLGALTVTRLLPASVWPSRNPSAILGEPYVSRIEALTLANYPAPVLADSVTYYLAKADHRRQRSDPRATTAYCDSARTALMAMGSDALTAQVAREPDGWLGSVLAMTYACLGRRAEALRWASAVANPATGANAMRASYAELGFARAYLLLGERDSAVVHLERASVPPRFSISPAWLKVDPFFAPLRGHPRFEALVAGGSR